MEILNARGRESAAARLAVGIVLMSVASLVVPVVDGIAKVLGSSHSPYLVAWARYATASLIVLPLTLIWYRRVYAARGDFASNALRTMLSVGAMTCFFFAITEIPLATAFGGYFLGPMIAALLATPLLHEKITRSRLGAAALGLVGALVIVRPGVDMKAGSLLAVLSGALFAGYLIATRMTAATTPPVDALQFQCVFGALLLTPFAIWHWSLPTRDEILLIAVMGGISAICHLMVIAAFRFAEASALSPLAYLELVTATLFGWVVFSELPDGLAVIGVTAIVLSGVLIWITEHTRGRAGSKRNVADIGP